MEEQLANLPLADVVVFGNPAYRWLIALVIGVVIVGVLFGLKRIALARLRRVTARTASGYDDVLVEVVGNTRSSTLFAAGLAGGVRTLDLPDVADLWIGRALFVVLALQCALWATQAVRLLFDRRRKESVAVDSPEHRTLSAAVSFVTRLVVWSVVLISILSNLGVEITTLIAGLGIGGLAAALAVQNVLGELVAAFSIYSDRPFDLGDFIIVDTYMGVVERIGWRSTQLRSLGGEMLVLANSDLAKSRIRNYKRMSERRVVIGFAVEYATPTDKLARVPAIVREEIAKLDKVRFDRAHLSSFAESTITFEVVYYVLDPDFNAHMDRQQTLLLALHRRLAEEGIGFGVPTRMVKVHGGEPGAESAAAGAA